MTETLYRYGMIDATPSLVYSIISVIFSSSEMPTREQVRMARAALNWSADTLAEKAGVNVNTIRRYENGADAMGATLTKIRRALEAAGVEFIAENGGGPGVRLRKS